MFVAPTKDQIRSGQGIGSAWQYQNRGAAAGRHSTAETVNAQFGLAGRSRRLMTPVGGGGAVLQMFRIAMDGGDYWVCVADNGGTLGIVYVNVLKPYNLRAGANGIPSQTIGGTAYTYTYTQVNDTTGLPAYFKRVVTGGTTSFTDYVVPPAIGNDGTLVVSSNDVILAIQTSNPDITLPTTVLSLTVAAGGTGYAVGNVLTLSGGTSVMPGGSAADAATALVIAVSGGAVTALSLLKAGNYTVNPPLAGCATTAVIGTGGSGPGTGCTLNVTMNPVWLDLNVAGRAWAYSPYN